MWIYPGSKGHLSFLQKKPRVQVQSCQHMGFSSCVHWPEVVPRAGKFQGQESANHTFNSKTFPAFYLNKPSLSSRAEGAGTSLSLQHPAKSASLTELPRTDQTLSGDLNCTFCPSPKCSIIQSENFTKLGQLQQADSVDFSNCRCFPQHNFSSDISGISTAKNK